MQMVKQVTHTDCLLACLAMVLGHTDTKTARSLVEKNPDEQDIEVADVMRVLGEQRRTAICITSTSVYVQQTAKKADDAEPMIRRHLARLIHEGRFGGVASVA
jgi:hypothetical protein